MNWFSDEVLFYGGIALTACTLAAAAATVLVFKIRTRRLRARLTEEYGPKKKNGEK
ncbi:MAG: hypothetical protein HFI63_05425 [Lachnospiraceae bacterium]|nr:hypothetical protein [Lachnospiraceae bacterium]